MEKEAYPFSGRRGKVWLKKDGRDELRKNSLSVLNTFQVMDCHPKTFGLQQAVRNGTSQRNALSLYRKQHITASGLENSTLHEVTAFWGQHSHSLGVKLTPQLDQENVCEHTGVRVSMCMWVCVCTHSCDSSMTHIPIFLLLRKLVDPSMCWYLEGVPLQAQLLWPKTKCHWLSNALHIVTLSPSLSFSSLFDPFCITPLLFQQTHFDCWLFFWLFI